MKKGDIETILNTGIPCYEPVDCNIFDMSLKCSMFKPDSISAERSLFENGREVIKKVLDVQIIPQDSTLFSKLSLGSRYTDSLVRFDFNSLSKFKSMFYPLSPNMEFFTGAECISSVRSKLSSLDSYVDSMIFEPYTKALHSNLKNDFGVLYKNWKFNQNMTNYFSNINSYYRDLFSHRSEIVNSNTEGFADRYFDTLDARKTAIYICTRHMFIIDKLVQSGDFERANYYLFFITAYLRNKSNNHKEDVDNIDYAYIKGWYDNLLKNYPELNNEYIDRDFFKNKTKEENINIISSIAEIKKVVLNKEMLKSGYVDREEPTHTTNAKEVEPLTEEDLAYIEKEIMKRKMFYLNHSPIAIVTGNGDFKKYDAFVYENGMIVADRFHNIYSLDQLKSDAVYGFDVENFDRLSDSNKQQLIEMGIPRFYHSEHWQEKVDEYINKETNPVIRTLAKEKYSKGKNIK